MKKLDGIIRSGMHKINAPISRARRLCAGLDIIAQRKILRSRFNIIFHTPKIKPLLTKYIPAGKYLIRFKTAAKALIISYLTPHAADCLIFDSPKWKISTIKMLKNLQHRFILKLNTARTFITSYTKGGNLNLVFGTNASVSSRKSAAGRLKMLFSSSYVHTNTQKYINVENKFVFLSAACKTRATRFLKSAYVNNLTLSPSIVRMNYGRFRLLSDMDDSALAAFDAVSLGDVDYIFFDN